MGVPWYLDFSLSQLCALCTFELTLNLAICRECSNESIDTITYTRHGQRLIDGLFCGDLRSLLILCSNKVALHYTSPQLACRLSRNNDVTFTVTLTLVKTERRTLILIIDKEVLARARVLPLL